MVVMRFHLSSFPLNERCFPSLSAKLQNWMNFSSFLLCGAFRTNILLYLTMYSINVDNFSKRLIQLMNRYVAKENMIQTTVQCKICCLFRRPQRISFVKQLMSNLTGMYKRNYFKINLKRNSHTSNR